MSSNQRLVVVDDTDQRITYIGDWFVDDLGSQDKLGNNGPTYQRTLHGTNATNASFSFVFKGSSIWAYGSVNPWPKELDEYGIPWQCYIDGKLVSAEGPLVQANNEPICSAPYLDDDVHQFRLELTNSTVSRTGHPFWFDSIQFAPSPGDSYTSSVLVVNNYDSSIKYEKGWILSETSLPSFTQRNDSRVEFDFIGTGLTWMGSILNDYNHNATSATYTIDGGTPVTFLVDSRDYDMTVDQHNIPLFTIIGLEPGPHSLVVTYDGDADHMPLTLDYIYLSNSTVLRNTTPTSIPTSTTTSTSLPITAKTKPVGAIAGGAAGGAIFLGLLIALLFHMWKRSKGLNKGRHSGLKVLPIHAPSPTASNLSLEASLHNVTPWVATQSEHGHDTRRSSRKTSMLSPTPLAAQTPESASRAGSHLDISTGEPKVDTHQDQNLVDTDVPVVRHRDSGIRLIDADGVLPHEVPPLYTPS